MNHYSVGSPTQLPHRKSAIEQIETGGTRVTSMKESGFGVRSLKNMPM
jgi:hypothetical protein